MNPDHKPLSRWLTIATLGLIGLCYTACKKEFKDKPATPRDLKTMSGSVPTTISIEEAYGRLPQTIMYNLADQVTLHLDKVQWRYEEEYLMARIPLNEAENRSYLYAVKPYNAPTGPVRAYLVQFFHDPGSTQDDFNVQAGMLDFCDTHQADAVTAEEKIARPLLNGPIIQFLKGQMTIQQFKDALNCP